MVNLEKQSNGLKLRERAEFDLTLSPNVNIFISFFKFGLTLSAKLGKFGERAKFH